MKYEKETIKDNNALILKIARPQLQIPKVKNWHSYAITLLVCIRIMPGLRPV